MEGADHVGEITLGIIARGLAAIRVFDRFLNLLTVQIGHRAQRSLIFLAQGRQVRHDGLFPACQLQFLAHIFANLG